MRRLLTVVFLVGLLSCVAAAFWASPQELFTDGSIPTAAEATEKRAPDRADHGAAFVATPVESARRPSDAHDAPLIQHIGSRSVVVRAEKFSDLLETYDAIARSELEDFNQRYYGAVAFASQKEHDWLASNGYPLPDEIVQAAAMSMRELEALADSGDEKAEFLIFDRLLEDLMRARENHLGAGLHTGTLGDNREYIQAFAAVDKYRARVADNDSPFTGHMLARFYERTLNNPYAAIGALYLSGSRGDHEASAAAAELVRRYQLDADVRDALASFSLVVRDRYSGSYQASPRPGT